MNRFSTLLYSSVFFLLLPFLKAGAQTPEMVVNEYYNSSSSAQEWTEVVVTRNGQNLAGYVLTDNNIDQGSWQGGVIFKNIPLWQNMREGTIIIIWHRNNGSIINDILKEDGYIEVSRDDLTLFDKFNQQASDYDRDALSISADGDILQIRNSDGNSITAHVHALGHKNEPGGSYKALVNNGKPILNTFERCADGSSNAAIPGRFLSDYTGTNKSQIVSGSNITRGLPNRNSANLNSENYKFWEELREPEWTATNSLEYTYNAVAPKGITLKWKPLENASDAEGYVIFRAKTFPATMPVLDGYIFSKGSPVPSFPDIIVVDVIPATQSTYTENFTSSYDLPCGEFYDYRIYPFRYGKDNQNKDIEPLHARGRSYNEEQFAKITVSRPAFPFPPSITSATGSQFVYCEGQGISLIAVPSDAASYQWFKNGAAITGATGNTYLATSEGKYSVRAFNAEGCAEASQEITVFKSTFPEALINSPTDIKICELADTTLTASPVESGFQYQWLDGSNSPISGATTSNLTTNKEGNYRVVVTNGSGCSDTSSAVTVRFLKPDLNFKNVQNTAIIKMDFGTLDECESSTIDTLLVETLSSDPFAVVIQAPAGFSVSPSTFIINQSNPQLVQVTFSPLEAKTYTALLKIESDCGFTRSIELEGTKEKVNVAAINSSVDFPITVSCEAQTVKEIVKIVNTGNNDVSFQQPVVSAPFTITAPVFPVPVSPGDTLAVTVEYQPNIGQISRVALFPYTSIACTDSIRVSLNANTVQPTITAAESEVDFKNLEGCTSQKDTTIAITNSSDYPLMIPAQQLDANFSVTQPVSLLPKETQNVRIRFTPSVSGPISSNVLLKADKCPELANIALLLKGSSGAPAIQSIPEYETLTNCTPAFKTVQSRVTTTSPTTIENITVPPGFSVSGISAGQVINGIQVFDVTFTPPGDGIFDDSLSISFAGCPQPKKILLKGRKSTLSFAFAGSGEVDFATVTPNSGAVSQTAVLTNTGNDSITVNPLNIPAPFKIASTSRPLPARIAPGEQITFTFEYAPTAEKNDQFQLQQNICSGIPALLLKGKAEYPAGTGKAVVSLPVLRGAPGSVIEIPVNIANEANSFALEKAAISEISMQLSYDPMLLVPQSVRIAAGTQGFDQATIRELSPGIAEVVLKSTGGAVITPGTAAIISAKVLLGSNPSTSIVFSNITPVGNNLVVFTQQNGEFILDDSCSAGRRIGGFSGEFMLKVSGGVPVSGESVDVVFETNTDEVLSLEIYNSFGQRVKTIFKSEVSAGKYENETPVYDLANGAYYIIMQNATNRTAAKFIISR
jgi:hypothetical protein